LKASFGTYWIASGTMEGIFGLTLNGVQVNDQVELFRALTAVFYGRGNRSAILGFSVKRIPADLGTAEYTAMTEFWALPVQADLWLYLDPEANGVALQFASAVLHNTEYGPTVGQSMPVRYQFKVVMPLTSNPPPNIPQPTSAMIQRSTVAITNGSASLAVSFSSSFSGTPIVVATINAPAGQPIISVNVLAGSVTNVGFTAEFGATIPASGYLLSYIASA
jgi:hypothetical protein